MKRFTFASAICAVLVSAAAMAAAPQGAPAAATGAAATTPPCMQGGKMGPGPCPGMQGGMRGQGMMGPGMVGNHPCPAVQGGKRAPGHCACPAMSSPRKGGGNCACPCPGVSTMAPGAVSKTGPAGSTNPAVYGWQLMTAEEKAAYRAKLRAAKTPEERAQIRAAHHKEMEQRAKQQGVTLAPPAATH